MLLLLLPYAILGLIGGYIAAHKGYPPFWGILVGVILGPAAILIASLLPPTKRGREQTELETKTRLELEHSRQTQACPKCSRQNSVVTRICPQCGFRFTT